MVVIDEKMALPVAPPPYASGSSAPPPFPCGRRRSMSMSTLPPNLLLHIIYMTFPQTAGIDEGPLVRQRKTLYWLTYHLRLVNRGFYIGTHPYVTVTIWELTRSIHSMYACPPLVLSSRVHLSDTCTVHIRSLPHVLFDLIHGQPSRHGPTRDPSV